MADLPTMPYEISIWEDIPVEPTSEKDIGHFEERKISVIGTNKDKAAGSAFDPLLKEGINGERVLTFKLPRKYRNNVGVLIDNPYIKLLTSERKIKFRDGEEYSFFNEEGTFLPEKLKEEDDQDRWIDFIIKQVDEDKNSYVNTYTCKELFVNELGKNGWSVVLDSELENNYGTLPQLGEKILAGSDWTVNGYSPVERVYEPLFICTDDISVSAEKVIPKNGSPTSIKTKNIYAFYSQLESSTTISGQIVWTFKKDVKKQVLYNQGKLFSEKDLDENRRVVDDNDEYNYFIETTSSLHFIPTSGTGNIQGAAIQGGKIIESIRTHWDPVGEHYVQDYTVINAASGAILGKEVYGYIEDKIVTSEMVQNQLANSNNFISQVGWISEAGDGQVCGLRTLPALRGNETAQEIIENKALVNTLVLPGDKVICNEGPVANRLRLVRDKKYVIKVCMRAVYFDTNSPQKDTVLTGNLYNSMGPVRVSLGYRELSNGVMKYYPLTERKQIVTTGTDSKGYPTISIGSEMPTVDTDKDTQKNFVYVVVSPNADLNKIRDIYLGIETTNKNTSYKWHIEDIQMFDYVVGENKEIIYPDSIPEAKVIKVPHFYYVKDKKVIDLSSNEKYYKPIMVEGYSSIRHISVKESNYFNNLNNLAELFECWVKFHVYHQKDGKLLYEGASKTPKKVVEFYRFNPNDKMNWSGFKYGINLNSIQRNTESDTIATKVIVKNNSNEFATDGMCSIKRAVDNPTKENIIYNFDYYVAHGLLDQNTLWRDLYGLTSKDFGYYRQLDAINNILIPQEAKLEAYRGAKYSAEELYNYSDLGKKAAAEEIENRKFYYENSLKVWGKVGEDGQMDYSDPHILADATALAQLVARQEEFTIAAAKYKNQIDKYEEKIIALSKIVEEQKTLKRQIDLQFYKKYSRYIQEATWTDDKYIDDNLYYLDALKVAGQNIWPKTKYQIGVIDIGGKPEYAAYTFKIGQRSTIEDTDFFGYTNILINGQNIKTPIKKEVIVSERVRNFDNPSQSTLVVQTYKNQFEELFSKMSATTTSLQYASGGFQRAANAILPDGSVKIKSVEQAFANNAFILANSKNQNVSWDSGAGIEVTDVKNPLMAVRITSNGIMMTTDAGKTWINGITAEGFNTHLLRAGQIDASRINIISSASDYAFSWTETGLNAYEPGTGGEHYVRFNQYGVYGTLTGKVLDEQLKGVENTQQAIKIIKDNSTFSITWNGLTLNYQDGSTSLSAENGLEVYGLWDFPKSIFDYPYRYDPSGKAYARKDGQESGEYIKEKIPLVSLGRYYTDQNSVNQKRYSYGLRMRNREGKLTLTTDNDSGNLWLANELRFGVDPAFGSEAGVNGNSTLNEDGSSPSAFWGGVDREIVPILNGGTPGYLFSVNHAGELFAQSANITGSIHATSGEFTGTVNAQQGLFSGSISVGFGTRLEILPPIIEIDPDTGELVPEIKPVPKPEAIDKNPYNSGMNNGPTEEKNFYIWGGREKIGEEEDTFMYDTGEPILDEAGQEQKQLYNLYDPIPIFGVDYEGRLYAKEANIHGVIEAIDGSFSGTITARNGYIDKLYFDNERTSFIGNNRSSEEFLFNIKNNYLIDSEGNAYASSLGLSKNRLWQSTEKEKDKYNILIGQDDILTVFDPSSSIDPQQREKIFAITKEGSINMKGNLYVGNDFGLNGNLRLNGNISMFREGRLELIINNDENGAYISATKNGAEVDGWKIDGQGNAIFNDIRARGKISSLVFESDYKSAVGGELVVAPIVYTIKEIPISTLSDGQFYLIGKDEGLSDAKIWQKVSTISINIEGVGELNNIKCSFDAETQSLKIPATLGREFLPSGTQIISQSTEVNSITLTAKDARGPSIIMLDSTTNQTHSVVIGNLGIVNSNEKELYFGSASLGYGLYAENAFLTGKLYLPNAGITNLGDSPDSVRIWAGAAPANKETAPFRITQDGSLYAKKGIFEGQIMASNSSFSGVISAAGVLLTKDDKDPLTYDNTHFYFKWEDEGEENYLIDINKNGLNLWEGFNIFSDFYSSDSLYGKTGVQSTYWPDAKNPWPILSLIDHKDSSIITYDEFGSNFIKVDNFVPRISLTDLQIWKADEKNLLNGSKQRSINIGNGTIDFVSKIINKDIRQLSDGGYSAMAEDLWSSEFDFSIGLQKDYIGFSGSEIIFSNGEKSQAALIVEPAKKIQDKTIPAKTSLKGTLQFEDSMEIITVEDGIIFNFIGEEKE